MRLGEKSTEGIFDMKAVMSGKTLTLWKQICVRKILCRSESLNPRPPDKWKGEGKKSSLHHVTPPVW